MAFDLAAIVDEIADQLDTIDDLHVHRFGPDAKRLEVLPAAIVALPTQPISYVETGLPGGPAARTVLPIVVAVSQVHSATSHRTLAEFMSSTGDHSIRACIEAGDYVTVSDPTILECVPDEMTIAGDTYLVAIFDLQVME